jgi:hypothetical protein
MDAHALEFYSAYSDDNPHGHFHRVLALHENKHVDWLHASSMSPNLPKGWYELAQLPASDRIGFTKEFWLSRLPYHPKLNSFLDNFFNSLDDVCVFLTQIGNDESFDSHMIYSLSGNSGFFQGSPPAMEMQIIQLKKHFQNYILPPDYLNFLTIHNGFKKLTDTGVMNCESVQLHDPMFRNFLEKRGPIITSKGDTVDPNSLIAFYKSFNMLFYQCFWSGWCPENEMGNVYYSGETHTISECTTCDPHVETMAFETFIDWLIFYLEKID